MWTSENRAKYNRDHLRYPSDLTDDEWALVEPFIRKRRELPRPPGCYARVLKRVGIQYCRISSTTAGMSL